VIEPRVVRRYASALFNAAAREDVVDRVESDLGLVSYAAETSPGLMSALRSPVVTTEVKRGVLHDLFADKVHPITLSYLYLLVEKRREEALTATENEYLTLAEEARGIITAHVTTAARLTEDAEAHLMAAISQLTGKSVRLDKTVDHSLIGGVTLRIGDRVIDGSIKGQLEAIKERLIS
jgi:F-type H+-transporting ATPase subunit delta